MISVIIPVYNTEKYLNRCIDSVLSSVCQDFELLLINDGSADGSAGICREYEKKDPRVRYFEQKNQGVSAARNKGIEECRGEWVVFVDSDDFITRDFLSCAAREENRQYDLLIFDRMLFKGGEKEPKEMKSAFPGPDSRLFGKEERIFLMRKVLNGEPFVKGGAVNPISIWAKAYKRSVLIDHSLRFPIDTAIGEDEIFNIGYIQKINSCLYKQRAVYYYAIRPDSAVHKFGEDVVHNDVVRQSRLKEDLKKYAVFEQVSEAYYNGVLFGMADLLIKKIFHPQNSASFREQCSLCREMSGNDLYREALRYNGRIGRFSRKILLYLFRLKCWRAVRLMCAVSFRILEGMKQI